MAGSPARWWLGPRERRGRKRDPFQRAGSQVVSPLAAARREEGIGTRVSAGSGPGDPAQPGPAPPPPPTSGAGSFVCSVDFGARVRGCLGFGVRPSQGAGRGGASARIRSESGIRTPPTHFCHPARRAICNAKSLRLQAPESAPDPQALGASPARGPPPSVSPLPLRRRSSEGKFCNPGQTNAGLAQA